MGHNYNLGGRGIALQKTLQSWGLNHNGGATYRVCSPFAPGQWVRSDEGWSLEEGCWKQEKKFPKDTLTKSSPLLAPDPSPCVRPNSITPLNYSLQRKSYCAANIRAWNSFFFTFRKITKSRNHSVTTLTTLTRPWRSEDWYQIELRLQPQHSPLKGPEDCSSRKSTFNHDYSLRRWLPKCLIYARAFCKYSYLVTSGAAKKAPNDEATLYDSDPDENIFQIA